MNKRMPEFHFRTGTLYLQIFYNILQYENRTCTKLLTLGYYGSKQTDIFKDDEGSLVYIGPSFTC